MDDIGYCLHKCEIHDKTTGIDIACKSQDRGDHQVNTGLKVFF